MFIFTIGPMSAVMHCNEVNGFKYIMRFSMFLVVSHVSESTGTFSMTYCKTSVVQVVS